MDKAMDSYRARRVAVVLAAVVVAVLVWLIFIKDDDGGSAGSAGGGKTVEVHSAAELPAAAVAAGHPVYWVGPQPGVEYELTVISDGRTYVRYLPAGVSAEAPTPYLTVGSYAQQAPLDVLKQLDEQNGTNTFSLTGGGLALAQSGAPNSVYVAYPGIDVQIEVYDPAPGRAEDLVKQGELLPIG